MEVLFDCGAKRITCSSRIGSCVLQVLACAQLTLFVFPVTLEMKNMAQEKTKPVHEIRLGRIRAALWENATQNGTRHNVTVSRLYKDGDKWKDSTSFGREDLPLVIKVLDMAHTWIYEHPSSTNSSDSNE